MLKFYRVYYINNNTERTLDFVFTRFRGFFVHNNPEVGAQMSYVHAISLSCHSTRHARNSFGLEKTTSSVLSLLLLIYYQYWFLLSTYLYLVSCVDLACQQRVSLSCMLNHLGNYLLINESFFKLLKILNWVPWIPPYWCGSFL